MKKYLDVLVKVLYSVPIMVFGILHLMNGPAMAGLVPAFLPFKVFWVYLTGLAMIAAPVAIIANKYAKLAALLLGILITSYAIFIHMPGLMNPETMQASMSQFLKDLSIAGGAYFISSRSTK